MRPDATWAALSALLLMACTPALNWREVRFPAGDAIAMFPCKPDRATRVVSLAGARVEMQLLSCRTSGTTYALADAAMGDPAKLAIALAELRDAAARNIGAQTAHASPFEVRGMTPHPLAQRWRLQGHGIDGKPVAEQAALFTRGLHVYQATVLGPHIDPEAADVFFGGLRLAS